MNASFQWNHFKYLYSRYYTSILANKIYLTPSLCLFCLGNYSDVSNSFSMTYIGNNFLNKHIQFKLGKLLNCFELIIEIITCPVWAPEVMAHDHYQQTRFWKNIHNFPWFLSWCCSSVLAPDQPLVSSLHADLLCSTPRSLENVGSR